MVKKNINYHLVLTHCIRDNTPCSECTGIELGYEKDDGKIKHYCYKYGNKEVEPHYET